VGDVSDETAYDKDATCVDLVDKDKSFFLANLQLRLTQRRQLAVMTWAIVNRESVNNSLGLIVK